MNLLGSLTPFSNRQVILKRNQEVKDIITGIIATHYIWRSDYDKICRSFDAGTTRAIGRKIWNYLKANVPYKIEPDHKQTLRSPAAILGMLGGADCKSYALFIGGCLDALNRKGKKINWAYRFASYKLLNPEPQHVFVVINPDTENEIWVDPVLSYYDEKKLYTYKTDKNIKMALYQISGIGATKKAAKKAAKAAAPKPAPAIKPAAAAPKKKGIKKVTAAVKKATQTVAKKVVQAAKATGKVTLKFAAAPSRNAFLLLVKENVGGLGTKLNKARATKGADLFILWGQLQGDKNSLDKAITQGSKKKRIFGIGAAPAAAVVAAATPILIKVANFLKSVGVDPENLANLALDKAREIASNKLSEAVEVAKEANAEAAQEYSQEERQLDIQPPRSSSAPANYNLPTRGEAAAMDQAPAAQGQGMDYKKLLIPAAVAAGVIFLISSRRK
jgi:hypothetical protein